MSSWTFAVTRGAVVVLPAVVFDWSFGVYLVWALIAASIFAVHEVYSADPRRKDRR